MSAGDSNIGGVSLLDLFRAEVEEHTGVLTDALLDLERDPDKAQDVEALMRAAHSVKGAARIVQIDVAADLSHKMENFFVAVQEGRSNLTSEHVDTLLKGVDLLRVIAEAADDIASWQAANQEAATALLASIEALESMPMTAAPPSASTATPDPSPAAGASDLLDLFANEIQSQAAVLSDSLLALERDLDSAVDVEGLMRAAHSIKGAARIVQIDVAAELAHAMEDFFVGIQQGRVRAGTESVDLLLYGVDVFASLATLSGPEFSPWLESHKAGIEDLIRSITTAGTSQVDGSSTTTTEPPLFASSEPSPEADEDRLTGSAPAPSSLDEQRDRVVRVASENLNRLMGLVGESVVEARWLQPFADSLQRLKGDQFEVATLVDQIKDSLEHSWSPEHATIRFQELRAQLDECRTYLGDRLSDLEIYARRSENLSDRLYREVIASRMRPFADGVQGFPRLVRDISRSLGKSVRLEIVGKGTEVDRDILDRLEAPLNHLLRNSLDHGIETAEVRRSAGKPEEGTIRLEARHAAGMLAISVEDDGCGIDPQSLRQNIVGKQLIDAETASQLSETELIEFLFLPAFSTAEEVTEISGRGVGLDVVKNMVQQVGGTLRAESLIEAVEDLIGSA